MSLIRDALEKRARGALRVAYGPPSEPTEELLRLFGAQQTASGVNITEATALHVSPYWACTRVIAEDVASLPLPVYRQLNPGKTRAPEHPLYRLLHDEPNPEMQAMGFRETVTGHAVTWGNGFAEIERSNAGTIKHLWPLRPDHMRLERREGQLYYLYTVGGVTYVLRPEQVLHVHGMSFEGIVGYSVARTAAQSLGLTAALEEYAARLFSNGAAPRGVLERPEGNKPLKDAAIERLRTQWDETYGGLSNAHRIAILEEGVKYEKVGLPPEEAQMLESRQFQAIEVCRWFRMQPHKIGILDRATWGNIEQQNIEHGTDTIRPWCVRWEQAIAARCFTPRERREYVAEHLLDAILRGDSKARHETYASGIQNGYYCPNDIAELENRNPIEGGDTYFVPLNLIPLHVASEQQPEPDPPAPAASAADIRRQRAALARERTAYAYRPAVEAAWKSLLAEERRTIVPAVEALADASDPALEIEAAVTEACEGLTRAGARLLTPSALAFASALNELVGPLANGPLSEQETEDAARVCVGARITDHLAETQAAVLVNWANIAVPFDAWVSEVRAGSDADGLLEAVAHAIIPDALREQSAT